MGHSSDPFEISPEATCLAARADLLYRNPSIQVTPYNMEPVFYYENFGHAKNATLQSALCQFNAHFPEESICDCPEARSQYLAEYPSLGRMSNLKYISYGADAKGIFSHCRTGT